MQFVDFVSATRYSDKQQPQSCAGQAPMKAKKATSCKGSKFMSRVEAVRTAKNHVVDRNS